MKTRFKTSSENSFKKLLKNSNFRNNQNYIFGGKLKINSLNFAYSISEKGGLLNKKNFYLKDIKTDKNLNNHLNIGEIGYVKFSNNSIYGKLGANTESVYFLFTQIIFLGITYIILGDVILKELGELINFMLILIILFLIFGLLKFFYYKNIIKNYIFYKPNIRKCKIIIYRYK